MGSLGHTGLWRSGRLAEDGAEWPSMSRSVEMSSGENDVHYGGLSSPRGRGRKGVRYVVGFAGS